MQRVFFYLELILRSTYTAQKDVWTFE